MVQSDQVGVSVERGESSFNEPVTGLVSWRARSAEHRRFVEKAEQTARFNKWSPKAVVSRMLRALGYEVRKLRQVNGHVGATLEQRLLAEEHHRFYGRPWCLGRDHFDYLISRGLKPEHRFLDVGCGALRTGIWIIPYLDTGHYFGIDADLTGLLAGAQYEIPFHRFEPKRPRLLHSDRFELNRWNEHFDWIFAFGVIQHLEPELQRVALSRMAEVLAIEGRIVITPFVPFDGRELEGVFGLQIMHEVVTKPRLFSNDITWIELMRSGSRRS